LRKRIDQLRRVDPAKVLHEVRVRQSVFLFWRAFEIIQDFLFGCRNHCIANGDLILRDQSSFARIEPRHGTPR
jgi:hypothetical protein